MKNIFEPSEEFKAHCDRLILENGNDAAFMEGIAILDKEARECGMTLHQYVRMRTIEIDNRERAKEWLQKKQRA